MKQVLNLIGLAYRARKCSLGVETIIENIDNKRTYLVLIATDTKENSKKKLINKCKSYEIPYYMLSNRKTLGNAVGKDSRVAIGILDKGFARTIQSLLEKIAG